MVAVIVVPHVGCGDNDVRFFRFAQGFNHFFGFFCRDTEFSVREVARITDFRCVIRCQADYRNFYTLLIKHGIRLKQAFTGTFLIDIGGQERECGPFFLNAQRFQRIIKLVVAQRHRIITDQIHPFEIRFGIL